MARSCCCTGYLTNPGGACCMDLRESGSTTYQPWTIPVPYSPPIPYSPPPPPSPPPTYVYVGLTEERVREIIREEIRAALRESGLRSITLGPDS